MIERPSYFISHAGALGPYAEFPVFTRRPDGAWKLPDEIVR
jgi:hypothetical protein